MKLLTACLGLSLLLGACARGTQVSNVSTAQNTVQPAQAATPAAASAATPSAPSLPPLSQGVVLRMTVEGGPDRKPRITGETNLPDATEIMFGIEGKTSNFSGGDKGVVGGGRFRSAGFGPDGGLKAGQYVAEVTMPIPDVQPPQVRAVIGAHGENLRGPLVKKGSIGTTVEVEQAFQLEEGGSIKGGTDKAQVAAATGEVKDVLQAVRALEQQGRGMEALRRGYPGDLGKIRQCGDLMRERQPQARSLRERAEALPNPFSIHLAAAATELILCVSCSRSALQNCDRALSSIDDASRATARK